MSLDAATSPAFWIALFFTIATMPILARSTLRRSARVAFAVAAVLLASAAAAPTLLMSRPPVVVVMVDCSASTRSADYRRTLNERISQLLAQPPQRIIFFAEHNADSNANGVISDLPGDRTHFAPPPADAILLFSDGQFELPAAAAPTYVVLDEGLRTARDARIARAAQRGDQIDLTLVNTGDARTLSSGKITVAVPGGTQLYSLPTQSPEAVTARLNPGDSWPENDTTTITPAAANETLWWIGDRAPGGFTSIDPAAAIETGSMIGVSAIVLNHTPAAAMSEDLMQSLAGYVRDLGGTLIINGGTNAFAAGGWTGTSVDALSPLAASPPSPQRLWMVLIDASGSMAGDTSHGTRLQSAVAAARAALHRLPPDDRAMLAAFADQLSWLTPEAKSVRELREHELSPPEPRGPTNLSSALTAIAGTPNPLPRELLLITDGETAAPIAVTAAQLNAAGVRPSVLLIGPRNRATSLIQLVERCGGAVIEQTDPAQWQAAAQQLAQVRQNARWLNGPFSVRLSDPVDAALDAVSNANETWLRAGATALGTLSPANSPAAAMWQAGAGRVLAFAFDAPPPVLTRGADRLRAAVPDPRFTTRLIQGNDDIIDVTAVERGAAMNDLRLTVGGLGGVAMPMQQVGPGQYQLHAARRTTGRIVEVIASGVVVDRITVAGRYAEEFDAIGLNIENLRALANRTGGSVIEPTQVKPIPLPKTTTRRPLASWLTLTAAGAVAVGLVAQARQARPTRKS